MTKPRKSKTNLSSTHKKRGNNKKFIKIRERKVELECKNSKRKNKTNLMVPSNRGAYSTVASNNRGGISSTLQQNENQIEKMEERRTREMINFHSKQSYSLYRRRGSFSKDYR